MKSDAARVACRTVACVVVMRCLTATPGRGQDSQPDRPEESGPAGLTEQSAPPADEREGRSISAESEPETPQTSHPLMRPAVGIINIEVPGAYDWFVRFGVRYMF